MLNLRVDTVRLPSGKTASREIVEHSGAVTIVPVDEDGNLLLVRQYRKAAGESLLEFPAGGIDAGEEPEACAQRELQKRRVTPPPRSHLWAPSGWSPGMPPNT